MIQLFKPQSIIILLICYVSIFKAQAQFNWEDHLLDRLNESSQFQKSIQVARFKFNKANSNEKKLIYNNYILRAYTNLGNNDSTLIYMKNSMDLLPLVQDSELICYTYLRLGIGYMENLDINSSTQYLLKAANLAKKINSTYILVRAYETLGNLIETETGNLKLALYYLNLSFEYANTENFDIKNSDYLQEKIIVLQNRAHIFMRLGKINEGFNDLFLAKTLINKLSNKEIYLIFLNIRLSVIYAQINDKINSDKYIAEALKISLKLNDIPLILESYRVRANICFDDKDYYKTIFYGLKAENYDNKNREHIASKIYMDSLLYLSYQYVGDNENALKYYKNFVDLKNKYYEKSKTNELNKLSLKLNLEENNKKLALKELELTKQKDTIEILVLIILIAVLVLLIIFGYKKFERECKKLLFNASENSDKEINSIKEWLEWRNNNKTIANSIAQTAVIENSLNSGTPELVNDYATNEPEISTESNDKINFNVETSNVNYTNLYFELREVMETKQLYLNPELSLDDLIKLLGTNKKYLYYAIKSNYEDNFKSLLNDYRINHVKSMIVESINTHKKIRMEEIQESSGFQSTASFFRVFKSKTGLTPLEYAEQVKRKQQSVA